MPERSSGSADGPGWSLPSITGLPERVWWCGSDEDPPGRIPLRAGSLTAVLKDGDLRYIRLGDREVIPRV